MMEAVHSYIQRHRLIQPGDRVCVAVSGGADSVALLLALIDLRNDLGIVLSVAHFNHGIRGAEADADQQFVADLARSHKLEFHSATGDAPTRAKQNRESLETAARELRYEFFRRLSEEGKASKIALAHTMDDQAETVLARMIRGTGLAGLSSIHPVRGKIIRPLIEIRRDDLRSFLAGHKQEWREDATNRDTQRLRARVRHRLLPELERNFSPSITDRLCDLASLARDDEDFWSALVEEHRQRLISPTTKGFSVDANELLFPIPDLPRQKGAASNPCHALTQRLVRRLYAATAQTKGQLTRNHVEQVVLLAEHGSSGRRLELPGGVTVEREFGRLIFRRSSRTNKLASVKKNFRATASYQYQVTLPESGSTAISIPELGRSFSLKMIDWPTAQRDTRREGVVLDAERLAAPLVFRNWSPGDAYRPSGRRQTRKLARMFVHGRVGVTERALWPVLTSAGRVAWADRMPVADEFSTTDATRTGLWIVVDGPLRQA